ncbi:hypothetical protein [Fusobacterium perfoetens]|uniref:hypothetical protein n=1 Tax=Fusobacterium perfoetens TaxID=852 RepID=UPI0004807411|nr:hypothetical protein [Fusobacterium perfoetens]MCI6153311.1 hypothetical protein [Fusobacterium perfoetens]MDY3237182.1 hypothetical protein [Fusobacterium perfoetens]
MDKVNKKRGFFLFEFLIILSIILLIFSFGYIRILKVKEEKDLEKAVLVISKTLEEYSTNSLLTTIKYKIRLEYNNNKIEIQKKSENKMLEEIIQLPNKLKYRIPYTINSNLKLLDSMEVETTINGNLSDSFTTYILDYSGNIKYRVAVYSFQENKLVKINIYKKISGKKISEDKLLDYHQRLFEEEELGNDWRKW